MLEVFEDVEQGTDAWFALRCGLPTASVFSDILAKPKEPSKGMRVNLLRKLAGERITGEPAEGFSNPYMERGKLLEPKARQLYAMLQDDDVREIGFMRSGRAGASPDGLVGKNGGLEIKTVTAAIMIEILDRSEAPTEHRAQIQGNLLISGRAWWDLMIYQGPKMPHRVFHVERDDGYIANLVGEIDRFNHDLDAMVDRVDGYSHCGRRAV